MSTSTPKDGGASQTSPPVKKLGTVSLSAGYRAAVPFVLVPRTKVTLSSPGIAVSFGSRFSLSMTQQCPIKGSSQHLPPGALKCALTWQVVRDGKPYSYPVDGEVVMKIEPGGDFEVEVNGKTPVVDLIAQQVFGTGTLGWTLSPDFPHADPVTLPATDAISFDYPLRVEPVLPKDKFLGEQVKFSFDFANIFNGAEFELRVIKLDDQGAGSQVVYTHLWKQHRLSSNSHRWSIGFTTDNCHELADMGPVTPGAYAFAWQLWGRNENGPQTLLMESKDFIKVPKPRLEDFRLEYDPSIEGTWEVSGKITQLAPRTTLRLSVALVHPRAQTQPDDPGAAAVQMVVEPDGVFESYLGARHWPFEKSDVQPPPSTNESITEGLLAFLSSRSARSGPPEPTFAILSLPAAMRNGKRSPIGAYLDFDELYFVAFKDHKVSLEEDAEWLCSREALETEPRPKKPLQRKRIRVTIPAPPAEAGDQKGPMTFDDMWNDLRAWEGVVPIMYLDKPPEGKQPNVTVGVGHLLATVEDARKLPFENKDAARAATPEEITSAYQKVKAMKGGMLYPEYAQRPMLAISDEVIRNLVKTRLEKEFLPQLKGVLPDFDTYPLCVRRGLLDIIYNCGLGGFTKRFADLINATKVRNWTQAAGFKCLNEGREERALWRKSLFQYAAIVEPPKKKA